MLLLKIFSKLRFSSSCIVQKVSRISIMSYYSYTVKANFSTYILSIAQLLYQKPQPIYFFKKGNCKEGIFFEGPTASKSASLLTLKCSELTYCKTHLLLLLLTLQFWNLGSVKEKEFSKWEKDEMFEDAWHTCWSLILWLYHSIH